MLKLLVLAEMFLLAFASISDSSSQSESDEENWVLRSAPWKHVRNSENSGELSRIQNETPNLVDRPYRINPNKLSALNNLDEENPSLPQRTQVQTKENVHKISDAVRNKEHNQIQSSEKVDNLDIQKQPSNSHSSNVSLHQHTLQPIVILSLTINKNSYVSVLSSKSNAQNNSIRAVSDCNHSISSQPQLKIQNATAVKVPGDHALGDETQNQNQGTPNNDIVNVPSLDTVTGQEASTFPESEEISPIERGSVTTENDTSPPSQCIVETKKLKTQIKEFMKNFGNRKKGHLTPCVVEANKLRKYVRILRTIQKRISLSETDDLICAGEIVGIQEELSQLSKNINENKIEQCVIIFQIIEGRMDSWAKKYLDVKNPKNLKH